MTKLFPQGTSLSSVCESRCLKAMSKNYTVLCYCIWTTLLVQNRDPQGESIRSCSRCICRMEALILLLFPSIRDPACASSLFISLPQYRPTAAGT